MFVHNLKFRITFVIGTLVLLSMILMGVVLILLWQRNTLEQELKQTDMLLDLAAVQILSQKEQGGRLHISELHQDILMRGSVTCLQIQTAAETQNILRACQDKNLSAELHAASRDSMKKVIRQAGLSWGVLTFYNNEIGVAAPLIERGELIGTISLIRDISSNYAAFKKTVTLGLAYLLINLVVITAIGFFRMDKMILRPIDKLVRLADSFADIREYSYLGGRESNDFQGLAYGLKRMISRSHSDNEKLRATVANLQKVNQQLREKKEEILQAEKLASIGRLSAGLAHEIGNPLGSILGYAEMLGSNDLTAEERSQYANRAQQELLRINELIRQLLDFSRTSHGSKQRVNIHTLLEQVVKLLRMEKHNSAIEMKQQFLAENSEIEVVTDQLHQVILNCLQNSIDAIKSSDNEDSGTIILKTINSKDEDGNALLCLEIIDNGTGIEQQHLQNVFDPFFSTKEVGKGTGLGLSVSHTIVESMDGKIRIESGQEGTTKVTIELPVKTGLQA